jgi:hypothetical protein
VGKPVLLELVKAGIVINRPGVVPWIERLPADVRKELDGVRRWFHGEGRLKRIPIKSVARSVAEQLKARKLRCPTAQTVESWLRKKD